MKRRVVVLLAATSIALASIGATGCAYRYKFATGAAASGERVTEWRHIAAWGYTETAPFDLDEACPNGVAEFGSYVSALNWLPALITIGAYTPRTVYAKCAK